MFNWKDAPFVRLCIPLLLGVLAYIYFNLNFIDYLFPVSVLLFLIFFLHSNYKKFEVIYKYHWLYGIGISLILFLIGFQLTHFNTDIYSKQYFANYLDTAEYAVIKIDEPIISKKKSYKTVANVIAIGNSSGQHACEGKLLVYFEKDDNAAEIEYGDVLVIESGFEEIVSPKNPSEFNYKKYLSFHNIHYQLFLTNSDWISTGENNGHVVFKTAYNLQKYFLNILDSHLHSYNELAVAAGIILGYRDYLDANIKQAYVSSGAMHVLAVSGLHVGIIYWILNFLLSFLNKNKKGRIIKTILLIVAITAFAFITGLSVSVQRASLMFIVIILGQAYNRYTNIYNVLAASAFILLCFNPYVIMEVGFQLSYMAVIGIVFLQPRIYKLIYVKNYVLDKMWVICSVSVAAQIATFPISLFYFHQFPTWFLLSNLVVIPAATLILFSGILLFVISPLTMLADIVGQALYFIVLALNKCIFFIEQMPYSFVQGISISAMETYILYVLIMLFITFVMIRRLYVLQCALAVAICLGGYNVYQKYVLLKQQTFIVYNIPYTSAYDFIQGSNSILLSDSACINQKDKLLFNIKNNWWAHQIIDNALLPIEGFLNQNKKFKNKYIYMRYPYVQFLDKRIVLLNTKPSDICADKKMKVNYVIISKSPFLSMQELIKYYDVDTIIFDSSNSSWKIAQWIRECKQLDLDYYAVTKQGAFVLKEG